MGKKMMQKISISYQNISYEEQKATHLHNINIKR